ncbi:hypothetical protein [Massilia luteola]|uniref:hypothetical protein n=1 Tax=Massilia luteola TaxID=3081751 RepID=UPI002ACC2412|nr:hypothetical protein [Massilia sp. Gc5]
MEHITMQTSMRDLDTVPDDLVRAVMYAFAMADYDGEDTVSIKAIQSSDILDGMSNDLVNEALGTAQHAGLVAWDEQRVGAIRLSKLGLKKFLLVRDGFFDEQENRRLRDTLSRIDPVELLASDVYKTMKRSCTGLAVFPGQLCPVTGEWQARRLDSKRLIIREGESVPFPQYDTHDRPVTWYLVTGTAGDEKFRARAQ